MNPYINLAKEAVERYIEKKKIIEPSSALPKEMLEKKAGVFVTIEKGGELRGCIGTYLPTRKNIAQEIIHNAIAAANEDYRFRPIQKKELPLLSYAVYILNIPEMVKDIKDLDPKKYGIIIKTINFPLRSALLLPGLEGIDTVEQQISIARRKGGVDPDERIIIYRFTAEKYRS